MPIFDRNKLLPSGARSGAVSQAQQFTNGIIGPNWKPVSDGTAAIQIQTAAGGDFATFDTTNRRVLLTDGNTPAAALLSTDALTMSANAQLGFSIVAATAAAGSRGIFKAVRARGTPGSPTTVVNGDTAFTLLSAVYDGTTLQNTALIEMFVDGAVSTGVAGQQIVFVTGETNSASRLARLVVKANGYISVGSPTAVVPTALLQLAASTAARAPLRFLPTSAVDPTTPNNGDLWFGTGLTIFGETSATNVVVESLRLRRSSSGTPAAGFGSSIVMPLKSSTTANQEAGLIEVIWQTATHASRAADMVLSAFYTSTKREFLRGRGGASDAQIGFLGATPVSRPAVTGSRGGNAALASFLTALANLGLVTDSTTA